MAQTKKNLVVEGKTYAYYSLKEAQNQGLASDLDKLPKSLKVLLENLLRYHDEKVVTSENIKELGNWTNSRKRGNEIAYHPARVLMQDFTGVPGVVDLAAMRESLKSLGEDPAKINPLSQVDLVIDHSVSVEQFGGSDSFKKNVAIEFDRNEERYSFLRWGQKAFENFRVVPPGTGICHQVNLENLAQVVFSKEVDGETFAYPDTLVGTDSHTTMINGLSVLGWGVGGIEAEAAMLGQPVSMLIPEVVGFKMKGKLAEGVTATDLVLTVVEMLRAKGVVGKFVEFFGPSLSELTLADQATIANMAPEYGATCGFFPINPETITYLKLTGRSEERVALVEAYAKEQGLWADANSADPTFSEMLELDISTVKPSIAGPKRPQDRVLLSEAKPSFDKVMSETFSVSDADFSKSVDVEGKDFNIENGDVVIAAITSCTNTSNPSVMLAAGLVAKKANELGLKVKPWVKTSLAPGSQVVTDYLVESGLQEHLDTLGFNLVGYGCTTCIGNSGPLAEPISKAIHAGDLVATSVLSGNRNFEGRVSPDVKANYLASPPLVVAYALAGSMKIDITKESIGKDKDGNDVFLKDVWPSNNEIKETLKTAISPKMFADRYANVFEGSDEWKAIPATDSLTYDWQESSTYIKHPNFFDGFSKEVPAVKKIENARALAVLGDSVTTDHISPAGSISGEIPAGQYLTEKGVKPYDFNSFGSRRGNHEVMMRGTFGNIRIKNEMVPGTEGGLTKYIPTGEKMYIYDAAMKYIQEGTPLVVIGGKEYGTGSSRDWAAKGTYLLGVKAVITESFERIHRSNLIGMGVLPLQFPEGVSRKTLGLDGSETYTLTGYEGGLNPQQSIKLTINFSSGEKKEVDLLSRLDTQNEVEYYTHGGILQYVMRNML